VTHLELGAQGLIEAYGRKFRGCVIDELGATDVAREAGDAHYVTFVLLKHRREESLHRLQCNRDTGLPLVFYGRAQCVLCAPEVSDYLQVSKTKKRRYLSLAKRKYSICHYSFLFFSLSPLLLLTCRLHLIGSRTGSFYLLFTLRLQFFRNSHSFVNT
jgi:hypothetical protein